MKNERPKSIKIPKNFETISYENNKPKLKLKINRKLNIRKLILNKAQFNYQTINTHYNCNSFKEESYPKINEIKKKNNSQLKTQIPNLISLIPKKNKNKNLEDEISYKIKWNSNNIFSNYNNNNNPKNKLIKNLKKKEIKISNPFLFEKISKRNKTINFDSNNSSSFTKREISLIDNPESFLYILFKNSKKLDDDLRKKNIKMKRKNQIYEEQRRDFKKNEEEVNKQKHLLNKDFNFYDQNKLTGKFYSTKTFMDLKIHLI